MEVLEMVVREYHKFQLEQYIYKLISPSCKREVWRFSEEGLFWYPNVEFVYFENIEDQLAAKAAGIAFSLLVCSRLTWEYYECLPKVSGFWSGYYDFLKEYLVKNFSVREQEQIFSFLEAQSFLSTSDRS